MAVIASLGFLEVASLPSGRLVISYTGNMGNTLDDVRSAFEGLYGKDRFARMLSRAKVEGSPDYLWQAVIEKVDFDQILTGATD